MGKFKKGPHNKFLLKKHHTSSDERILDEVLFNDVVRSSMVSSILDLLIDKLRLFLRASILFAIRITLIPFSTSMYLSVSSIIKIINIIYCLMKFTYYFWTFDEVYTLEIIILGSLAKY